MRGPSWVWAGNECEVKDLNRQGDYDLARNKAGEASQCRKFGMAVTLILLALRFFLEHHSVMRSSYG